NRVSPHRSRQDRPGTILRGIDPANLHENPVSAGLANDHRRVAGGRDIRIADRGWGGNGGIERRLGEPVGLLLLPRANGEFLCHHRDPRGGWHSRLHLLLLDRPEVGKLGGMIDSTYRTDRHPISW